MLLRAEHGHLVFCKGARQGSRLREHEARINDVLPECAPRLLWSLDVDGWVVLGFEAVPGDHADLSPNSPDLPKVAEAVQSLTSMGPLIIAGHTPRGAEQWADQFPDWHALDHETRTAFAVAVLGVWEHMRRTDPSPHREQLTDVARQWVQYRLGR